MGVSIYYGVYPKECDDVNIIPYLSHEPWNGFCWELNISKTSQENFFNCLRKHSDEVITNESNKVYCHCFVLTTYGNWFDFCKEVNCVFDEDFGCDFENDILIVWVM